MLGERLRMFRRRAKKSQAELAEVIGLSQSAYAKVENGQQRLHVTHLPLLAAYYDVSIDNLLGYNGNVHNDKYVNALGVFSDNDVSCSYILDTAVINVDGKIYEVKKSLVPALVHQVMDECDSMLASVKKPLFMRKLVERLERL